MNQSDREFIMAIDQGFTPSKVILVDRYPEIIEESYTNFATNYFDFIWIEFDAISVLSSACRI